MRKECDCQLSINSVCNISEDILATLLYRFSLDAFLEIYLVPLVNIQLHNAQYIFLLEVAELGL